MFGQAVGLTPNSKLKIDKLILDLPGNKVTAVLTNDFIYFAPLSSKCDDVYFPSCKGEFFAEHNVLPAYSGLASAFDYCSDVFGPIKGEIDVKRCELQQCDNEIYNFFGYYAGSEDVHTARMEDGHLVVSYKDCEVEFYAH